MLLVAVARGYYDSLGLKADGSIVAWGCNYYGRCDASTLNRTYGYWCGARYSVPNARVSSSGTIWQAVPWSQTSVFFGS